MLFCKHATRMCLEKGLKSCCLLFDVESNGVLDPPRHIFARMGTLPAIMASQSRFKIMSFSHIKMSIRRAVDQDVYVVEVCHKTAQRLIHQPGFAKATPRQSSHSVFHLVVQVWPAEAKSPTRRCGLGMKTGGGGENRTPVRSSVASVSTRVFCH